MSARWPPRLLPRYRWLLLRVRVRCAGWHARHRLRRGRCELHFYWTRGISWLEGWGFVCAPLRSMLVLRFGGRLSRYVQLIERARETSDRWYAQRHAYTRLLLRAQHETLKSIRARARRQS